MRIAIIAYFLTFGGIERQLTILANEMNDRGHEVHLVCMVADNICYEINHSVRKHFVRETRSGIQSIYFRWRGLRKVLNEIKPDITVTFMLQQAYLCAIMPKKITGKLLYSERIDPGNNSYSFSLRLIRLLTIHRIDGFVFQSKGAQSYFGKAVRKRSCVIANPAYIKRRDFQTIGERRKVIVSAGRLHKQKNQSLLLEAFAEVNKLYPEYNLEIYGEGELKDKLQEKSAKLGIAGKVKFMGNVVDLHERILNAAMFVLTSDYEGLPNVLIEAMALGIPCISTDCDPGGARELIANGEDGLIVPKQSVRHVTKAIIFYIRNPQKAEIIGRKAAKNIQRYRPEKIYNKWELFMKCLIEINK